MTEKMYTITAIFRGEKSEIDYLLSRIFDAQSMTGSPISTFSSYLIERALPLVELELRNKGKLEPEKYAMTLEYKRIQEEDAKNALLLDIYKSRGAEGFVTWAEKENIDYESFLTQYSWENENLRWSKRAIDWLKNYLIDGKPHSTADIRLDAIKDDIINDSEKEWGKLRLIASRNEFTNCNVYAHWQYISLATLAQIDEQKNTGDGTLFTDDDDEH